MNPKLTKSFIDILTLPRKASKLLLKLRLNVWKTKYVEGIKCICKENIDIDHILCKCEFMNNLYHQNNIIIDSTKDIKDILNDKNIIRVLNILLESPIANLL